MRFGKWNIASMLLKCETKELRLPSRERSMDSALKAVEGVGVGAGFRDKEVKQCRETEHQPMWPPAEQRQT